MQLLSSDFICHSSQLTQSQVQVKLEPQEDGYNEQMADQVTDNDTDNGMGIQEYGELTITVQALPPES